MTLHVNAWKVQQAYTASRPTLHTARISKWLATTTILIIGRTVVIISRYQEQHDHLLQS